MLTRALALLQPIAEGEVQRFGRTVPPAEIPKYRCEISYLPQRATMQEGTVLDNLKYPFSLAVHRHLRMDEHRCRDLFHRFGRSDSFLRQPSSELSGGESQIVALVRSIQLDPVVLLLDEPTSAMDPEAASVAESLIDEWVSHGGRAFLWISHDPEQSSRVDARLWTLDSEGLHEGTV